MSLFLMLTRLMSHREEREKQIIVTKVSRSTLSIEREKPNSLSRYAAAFGVGNEFTPNSIIIVAPVMSLTSVDWVSGQAVLPSLVRERESTDDSSSFPS